MAAMNTNTSAAPSTDKSLVAVRGFEPRIASEAFSSKEENLLTLQTEGMQTAVRCTSVLCQGSKHGAPLLPASVASPPAVRHPKARCPVCKRIRHLNAVGAFVSHGLGPSSFLCSGSGVMAC